MATKYFFSNACTSDTHNGWFIGHFLGTQDMRSTSDVEAKLGKHAAGEEKPRWTMNKRATTLCMLVSGQFEIMLPHKTFLLSSPGDYLTWEAGIPHKWRALHDSTMFTLRWPSLEGDVEEVPEDEVRQYLNLLGEDDTRRY